MRVGRGCWIAAFGPSVLLVVGWGFAVVGLERDRALTQVVALG